MRNIGTYSKLAAILVVSCVAAGSGIAAAQTWSSPQSVANGLGIAVATNGTGRSAVLFMPPSGGLQASVKTGSTWGNPGHPVIVG
jgi:hypothetical protein